MSVASDKIVAACRELREAIEGLSPDARELLDKWDAKHESYQLDSLLDTCRMIERELPLFLPAEEPKP